MGKIKGAFIMPHPPIIVPFIGSSETEKAAVTIDSMKESAKRIASLKPDTIIVISPHGNVFDDYVFMMNERFLTGNFHKFNNYSYTKSFNNDIDLLSEIINICRDNDFPAGILSSELRKQLNITDGIDHGALVPLYFIDEEYSNFKMLHISISNLDKRNLYRFGQYVNEAICSQNSDVVIIASGDLSHYLSDASPYGYRKEGPIFDKQLLEILQNNEFDKIFDLSEHLSEKAGQCGLRSFEILAGILTDIEKNIEVLSYEGPFGIGYLVADIMKNQKKSPYVKLAYDSIKHYLGTNSKLEKSDRKNTEKAGVFVSLKKHGELRGCIGTLEPCRDSIDEEIIENALSAAFHDPRFEPLKSDELDELDISVDVLSRAEKITDKGLLDPQRYGVIVSKGYRRGVLLPDLAGVDSVEYQLNIALQKAGIDPEEKYLIERFEVKRYR